MSDILKDVKGSLKSMLGQHLKVVLLIDRYGTQLASASDINLPKETLSRVCAVLYGSSERLGENLGKGAPRYIVLEYDGLVIHIVRSMSGKYIFVGVSDRPTQEVKSTLDGLAVKV